MIQSIPRVSGFIGEANHPTPLSDEDISTILDRVENRAAPKPKVFFETGEMVRIIDGPFANFTGTVDEYDLEHGTLKLNVSIFGRSTPVDISYTQVEKII
jgi:transcriptional antiterminator NusG